MDVQVMVLAAEPPGTYLTPYSLSFDRLKVNMLHASGRKVIFPEHRVIRKHGEYVSEGIPYS